MDGLGLAGSVTAGRLVSNAKLLESVLMLSPTTLEMGLTPLALLHPSSQDSLQEQIADLVAARDPSDRYSDIQIMSSDELKILVDTFTKCGIADNEMFKLRALLFCEDSQTIYLWNDKRRR